MRARTATYDYIVVGAGAAGCVVAARLTEDPDVSVLLLEAGGSDRHPAVAIPAAYSKLFRSSRDWAYRTDAQPELSGRSLYWPRGRMLGGSSSMNDMVYIRGNRADYDGWADAGNRGWGYADVLRYFRRSENQQRGPSPFHGVGGPLDVGDHRYVHPTTPAFLAAAADAGLEPTDDFNGAEQDGVGMHQVTQRNGRRASAATAFLRPALKRPRLTVVAGARATRVLFRGSQAIGVEWVRRGRVEQCLAAREVVLSGGTINSAQLLLLSGVGAADDVRRWGITPVADLPGVGRNLQDHLMVPVSWLSSTPSSLIDARKPTSVWAYGRRRRGPLSSNIGQAGAFVRTRAGLPAPDIQLVFTPVLLDGPRDEQVSEPTEHGFSISAALLQPASRGELRLSAADPFAPPQIDPCYLREADDLTTLVRGVELALDIGSRSALSRRSKARHAPAGGAPPALHRHVRAAADTMFHPVGTCRMGSDALAVVDEELRVRGVAGLRVVDASVFPTVPRGNTLAATLMVAERAAELIRRGSDRPQPVETGAEPSRAGNRRASTAR